VHTASDRARSLVPLVLGIVTLAAVVLLFAEDAVPRLLPAGSHEVLAAFSLAMIACAYMVFQLAHHRPLGELVKTILLAAAFLFWAANQLWPNLPQASLFNDIAIGLFVLDVFFVIAGWRAGSNDSLLDDRCGNSPNRCSCDCARCGGSAQAEDEVL
jgi:RsiW-degrading membrane proteinase PrsW (M82 family)